MKMTKKQCAIVTDNLDVVTVALRSLHVQHDTHLKQDLFQEGCLILCTIVMQSAIFNRKLAYTVIRNRMLDFLRKNQTWYRYNSITDTPADRPIDDLEHKLVSNIQYSELIKKIDSSILNKDSTKYKGVVALHYKANGYSNCDIAKMYRVPCNHVSAWLSKVRSDPKICSEILAAG